MGYHRAGFTEIVGVDIVKQPRYPFSFVLGEALEYVAAHGREFDAIHASPPCQQWTPLRARQGWREYPDCLPETRAALIKSKKLYVIENVPGAPIGRSATLCGAMFGLRTYRHRLFEASFHIWKPPIHPRHFHHTATRNRRAAFAHGMFISVTGDVGSWVGPAVMGIDWMTGNELSQAIPPAYTEFIGRQLLASL